MNSPTTPIKKPQGGMQVWQLLALLLLVAVPAAMLIAVFDWSRSFESMVATGLVRGVAIAVAVNIVGLGFRELVGSIIRTNRTSGEQ